MGELTRPAASLIDQADMGGTLGRSEGPKGEIPGADGVAHLLDVGELGSKQLDG